MRLLRLLLRLQLRAQILLLALLLPLAAPLVLLPLPPIPPLPAEDRLLRGAARGGGLASAADARAAQQSPAESPTALCAASASKYGASRAEPPRLGLQQPCGTTALAIAAPSATSRPTAGWAS